MKNKTAVNDNNQSFVSSKPVMCVSWCDADDVMNYGQILQGLAFMYVLREKTSGTIVYASYYPRSFKDKIRYLIKHVNPLNGHLFSYIKTDSIIKNWTREFDIKLLQVSDARKMEALSSDMSILICGSDQIWHPQNLDKVFFLNFGKECLWRFSYAASLPKTRAEKKFDTQFKIISEYLSKLDSISVREPSSCRLVSALSKQKVYSVLDPTLLVPPCIWENMANVECPNNYIFVYIPNGMNSQIEQVVGEVKEKMGIERVYAVITRGKNLFTSVRRLKFVSLPHFLSLIKNASCVITSSFHAAVFSVIFHKEFYCYDVPNEERGEDVRLSDLLNSINLVNRLVTDGLNGLKEKIDYRAVDTILAEKKEESLSFLEKNLMSKKNGQ